MIFCSECFKDSQIKEIIKSRKKAENVLRVVAKMHIFMIQQ